MDEELLRTTLATVLRNKGAVAAFLASQDDLDIANSEHRVELLRRAHIAKHLRKQLSPKETAVVEARELRRRLASQELGRVLHIAKTLALCSLPYERLKETALVRKANLGDGTEVHVRFSSHDPSIPLPYGKDRALLSWLMTEARERNSPRVEFATALEFLEEFGVERERGGKDYREFKDSMDRITNVVITYGYENSRVGVERDRGEKLVFDRHLPSRNDAQSEELGLVELAGMRAPYFVEFGAKTFEDLVHNPVSIPLDILKFYQANPVCWDFIQFCAAQEAAIPEGQSRVMPFTRVLEFLGTKDSNIRRIRNKIEDVLKEIGPDYFGHVQVVGRGRSAALVITGKPKELSSQAPSELSFDQATFIPQTKVIKVIPPPPPPPARRKKAKA